MIYPNDHDPPHVHVIGAEGEVKIALVAPGARPRLLSLEGLGRREVEMALRVVDSNSEALWEHGRRIHG